MWRMVYLSLIPTHTCHLRGAWYHWTGPSWSVGFWCFRGGAVCLWFSLPRLTKKLFFTEDTKSKTKGALSIPITLDFPLFLSADWKHVFISCEAFPKSILSKPVNSELLVADFLVVEMTYNGHFMCKMTFYYNFPLAGNHTTYCCLNSQLNPDDQDAHPFEMSL